MLAAEHDWTVEADRAADAVLADWWAGHARYLAEESAMVNDEAELGASIAAIAEARYLASMYHHQAKGAQDAQRI